MSDDTGESRVLRREIEESLIRARRAKTRYEQSAADGMNTAEIEQTMRDAAIELYNNLTWWRDDPQVNDIWADRGLDNFGKLLTEQTTRAVGGDPVLSTTDKQVSQLRVAELGPNQLATVINGLVEVAKELGFAPETTDRTVVEKGTIEDIRWLVNAREQNKAIKELEPPENDPEALPDGGVKTASNADSGPSIDGEVVERYPFRGPFFQLIADRKSQGKDAKIAVASANAETGVGKSTCAYYLAHVLDTSPSGYYIDDKATLGVDEFLGAYDRLGKGSALILDEAEQLTGRRAMAKENVKAGERWQMRRVQEICALLTLPKFSVLDPLMKDLVDFRIEIQSRGEAVIYKKSHRPFGDTWWEQVQRFQYPDMDPTAGMQRLHELKDEFLEEDDSGGLVSQSEAKEEVEKSVEDARRDERDRMIMTLYDAGKTQQEIADTLAEEYGEDSDLAVSRRRVGHILDERGEK